METNKRKAKWETVLWILVTTLLLTFWFTVSVPAATGNDPKNDPKPGAKTDKTAAPDWYNPKTETTRHRSMAEHYRQQAATHRDEVKQVWKRYEVERKKIAVLPKMAVENPQLKQLRAETERQAKEFAALADECEDLARHHQLRAREYAEQVKLARAASN